MQAQNPLCLKASNWLIFVSFGKQSFSNIVLSFFKYLNIFFERTKKPPLIYSVGFSFIVLILDFESINKTPLAKIAGIFIAENILNWVPKNTHDYNKLIKPDNLIKVLKKNNFKINHIQGMNFNPITREWNLSENFHPINYFCTAELI